jgi:hypothetical protein
MSASILYQNVQYIRSIEQIAEQHGITIEVSSDFDDFRKIRAAQPKRPPVSPVFDSHVCELDGRNGFWIKGTNASGELVHVQAVRLQDLGSASLADYLYRRRAVFAPPGVEVNLESSEFSASPATHSITGKVCYHGELWLKGGPNGYRGHGLTCALPRLALSLAYMTWSPDFMFGLVHPLAACKGLAAREGYMHLEPGGVLWQRPNAAGVYEEWLVWMSRNDLQHLLRFAPSDLYEQLEAKNNTGEVLANRVQVAA